jgi:hypothetical protein
MTPIVRFSRRAFLCLATFAAAAGAVSAEPWLAPGDASLRSDLATLADAGVLQAPLTTWPMPWSEIAADVRDASLAGLSGVELLALERVRTQAGLETRVREWTANVSASASQSPTVVRGFATSPRSEGEIGGGLSGTGSRFAVRLNAVRAWRPTDGDSVRLDGSYVGMTIGNWMLSAGYPERWWGPGWDGSLILSTNARPPPQLAINRNFSTPFRQRWLEWLGPWSLTSFMGELDDEGRVVDEPLLFGVRISAKPLPQFEFGLSRTAQWCGDGRTCNADTFADLLLGRDNRGVNVSEDEEPGNQLGGFDLRWALPFERVPTALYFQWIGEDTRQGGPQIGSWLREAGVEFSGTAFGDAWRHRSYFEYADSACQEGGGGFGGLKLACAYVHGIYQTGYRYQGRSLGHSVDGDGTSLSVGSILLRDDRAWRFSARHAKLNRAGVSAFHTLAAAPHKLTEAAVEHSRPLGIGTIRASFGVRRSEGATQPLFDDSHAYGSIEFVVD